MGAWRLTVRTRARNCGRCRWALWVTNPVTYEINGKQYIAVLGGRSTNPAAGLAKGAGDAGKNQNGPGPKLFIFTLDGKKSVEEALPRQ
jgi:hypothetical protein